MKNKKWLFVLLPFVLAIIILGVIVILFAPRKHIVEKYYFEKASAIPGYFSDIISRKGEPLEEKWTSLPDGLMYNELTYDGYRYTTGFSKYREGDMHCTAAVIEITDPAYKIGSKKLGVGSTKEQIEKAYRYSKPIKGFRKGNEFGYIDGAIWVEFTLGPDDTVAQIRIYIGP